MWKAIKTIKYLFFIGIIGFVLTGVTIVIDGLNDNIHKSDAIVVLGNKVELSGLPSQRLSYRLDKGLELYKNGVSSLIIVTGGQGIEGFDEAVIMKKYLVDKGIPEEVVGVDSFGIDTFESAKNIKKILKEKNLKSVLVVSSYYHISRTVLAFEKNEIPEVYSAHANFVEWRDLYSIPREVVGFYYYLFRKYSF